MKKQKVLLIGNGPSIFYSERGQEIDDFEGKIARFNHYKIESYEKYIGTRTDILVLGQLNVKEQLKTQYDYILLYQAKLDGGAGLRQIKELSPHNKVKFFPLVEKDKIKFILEMQSRIEPTTGIIAIHWFTRENIDLYVYGFDFSNMDYYAEEENINADKNHNSRKEAVYIDFLLEQKIIKRF